MVPPKVPQEEDSTQLKGTIIIQLEKHLHRTSELNPTKYDSLVLCVTEYLAWI